jgi:hypothetical protein
LHLLDNFLDIGFRTEAISVSIGSQVWSRAYTTEVETASKTRDSTIEFTMIVSEELERLRIETIRGHPCGRHMMTNQLEEM